MQSFFAPVIALMNRLKYPGKFAVTGALVFVATLILLVSLAAHLYADIRLARHELAVTELMLPLHKQIRLMQQHRGISAAMLGGAASMRMRLEQRQLEVSAALTAVDAVEARHFVLLGSGVEWRAIKDDWERLRRGVMSMTVGETLALHDDLIERTLRFQVAVADAGGLTLDREMDTYYLAVTLYRNLPLVLERLGKMRAKGAGILASKKLTDADRIEFAVHRLMLKNSLDSLKLDLKKAGSKSPVVAARLDLFATGLDQAIAAAMSLLDGVITGQHKAMAPEAFFDRFTKVIDLGYGELFDSLWPTLNQQLIQRISSLQIYLMLGVGLAATLLFLLTYIGFGTYYSIIESVRRLSVGAETLANGDLTARISLDGQDELTRVGDSFNSMASALDELWRKSRQTADALETALVEAKQADQAKDAFLANMSHELRTPLNAVIGMANMACGLCTDPRQRDYLNKIVDSGRHLNRIINDLLDLSKIAAGYMEFETVAFSAQGLLRQVNAVMAHRAEEKGLELVETVDAAVPAVLLGDPLRIEQIILNLVGNAIKFTPAGRVDVRICMLERESSRVCLEIDVADSGIGMRAEDLDRLFKPFSQADVSVSRQFGGTGLGLAISKRLAEMMGGDITVTSREGRGTSFKVRIWLGLGDTLDQPRDAPTGTEPSRVCYQNAHVLVAEDQPLNREIIEALLADVGIVPRMAENGQEAIDILTSGTAAFDLVLMDIQMPIMDGLTATRVIRKLDYFAQLPIIAMTAHTLAHEREISAAAGMNDHIGKPFDNATFYRTLARWIPQHKQIQRVAEDSPAPQEPVTEVASGLRSLRGIDVAAGLERFGGREDRYRHWLAEFAATAGAIPDKICSEMAAGAQDAAAKTAHAFKGRVGMLGMTALHVAATALEHAVRDRLPVDALLSDLRQLIGQMLEELATVLGTQDSARLSTSHDLEKIVWSEAYSVGVAELDGQHRKLIQMINQLADCIALRNAGTPGAFHGILSGLFDYCQFHFKAEEDYLQTIGYPQLAAHEREHAAFAEKVTGFNLAASHGTPDMGAMHHYLTAWLQTHILESDRQYREFIEGQPHAPSPLA